MQRGQFTFYRSFWDAVRGLPKRDRLPILEAIIGYALDELQPEGLSQSQGAFFLLCKPTLDASRKRAEGGKNGGSLSQANRKALASLPQACSKPASSLPQASCKPMASEKEKKNEKKNEIETEGEGEGEVEVDKNHRPPDQKERFDEFWEKYPVKIGYEQALAVWEDLHLSDPDFDRLMNALALWTDSHRWKEKNGKFIPRAARWLSEKHFLSPPEDAVPKGATGYLGQAEWEAIERILSQP